MSYKKICGIYKITSPSGKIYIGQSVNITSRWWQHRKSITTKHRSKLINSFKKYGVENHSFEIICHCEPCKLNELEVHYIAEFDTFNKYNGLNMLSGGDSNYESSEELKKKLSDAQKKLYASGYVAPATGTSRKFWGMYGKNHSEKTKRDHSERMKGRPAWNKGIAPSEEQSKKHSEFMKAYYKDRNHPSLGLKKTDEQRYKNGNGSRGRVHSSEEKEKRAKSILKIILDTNTGVYYIGLQEAADSVGMKKERLAARLNGHVRNKTGLIFTK